jgi:hypothetical protein
MQRKFMELQASKVMPDEILVMTRGVQGTGIAPYRSVPDYENLFSHTKNGHYALIRNVQTKICSLMLHRTHSKSSLNMRGAKSNIVRANTT